MSHSQPYPAWSDLFRSPVSPTEQLLSQISRFTTGGRYAMALGFEALMKQTAQRTVLVPAFHCPSIVEVVLSLGLQVRYYPLNTDLSIDAYGLKEQIDEDCLAVIAIQFYGRFFDLQDTRRICRSAGAMLIEDCSHGFVTGEPEALKLGGTQGDLSIYSFWKTIPCVAVGGIRLNNADIAPLQALTETSPSIGELIDLAQDSIDAHGPNLLHRLIQGVLELKQDVFTRSSVEANKLISDKGADAQVPTHYAYDHTEIQSSAWGGYKRLLLASDLRAIYTKRRVNLQRILNNIDSNLCAFSAPGANEHWWCLPIVVPDRAKVDYKMRAKGCKLFTFGETLHPSLNKTERHLRENGEYFSSQLLCLAVDHQCRDEDLDIAISSVAEFC